MLSVLVIIVEIFLIECRTHSSIRGCCEELRASLAGDPDGPADRLTVGAGRADLPRRPGGPSVVPVTNLPGLTAARHQRHLLGVVLARHHRAGAGELHERSSGVTCNTLLLAGNTPLGEYLC